MTRYDLFKINEEGPLWFGTADTLADAHAKVGELADCPECVIFDQTTGEKIVVKPGERAGR
jgi:hypothetical protein